MPSSNITSDCILSAFSFRSSAILEEMKERRQWLCTLCLLVLSLQVSFCEEEDSNGSRSESSTLPGHMQPLGSHRPPMLVQRIQHLPTPAEFHRTYVQPKVPVVMEGALNGATAWRNWQNDDYLRSTIGDEEVGVEEGKKENRSDPRYSLKFSEFLDRYQKEDIYMVSDLPLPLYKEWEVPRPLVCGGLLENVDIANIWFSNGGTNSVLHTDSYDNFHCLVTGQKKFRMFEPHHIKAIGPEHDEKGFYYVNVEKVDMTKYPALSKIPWYLAEVNEGDCLYLPFLWIHNVKSIGRNLGTNLWWNEFKFNASDCPPEQELPSYLALGSVMDMSPEKKLMTFINRAVDSDGSVKAEEVKKMLELETTEPVLELFDHLQPGCNGVLKNLETISEQQWKKAYNFLMEDMIEEAEESPEDIDEDIDTEELEEDIGKELEGEHANAHQEL